MPRLKYVHQYYALLHTKQSPRGIKLHIFCFELFAVQFILFEDTNLKKLEELNLKIELDSEDIKLE
jgi:hypothetical protein